MNLEFITVGKTEQNGRPYIIQKANITKNRQFWAEWKYACDLDNKAALLNCPSNIDTIKNHVLSLKREVIDNKKYYFVYRLLPCDNNHKPGSFNLSYILNDVSGLLPYQPKAVAHLCDSISRNGAAADGSDTGIGKTYHALSVCRNMLFHPLIICRKSGIPGWKTACKHFNIEPVLITNWENIKTGKGIFLKRNRHDYSGKYFYKWYLPKDVITIFDEAHSGCNDDSQNHALWVAIRGYVSLSLSATFADRITRLRGLFKVLNVMDDSQFDQWLTFRNLYENRYGKKESLSSTDDMKAANKILYPRFGYRVSCDDPEVKKFFPDGIYQTHLISIGKDKSDMQNKLYTELIEKVKYYREKGLQAEALVADLRYRQAVELLKVAPLIELTSEYLSQGLSVCIFVNFRETLSYLAQGLKTKSLIFGGQDRYNLSRENVIEDFQSNRTNIIIAMSHAGGQSISLHDITGKARRISLICPTYDPICLMQVLGRTRRAKSQSVPVMKLVYAADTIEERVAHTVNEKLNNISALNDGDLMEPDIFSLGVKREHNDAD